MGSNLWSAIVATSAHQNGKLEQVLSLVDELSAQEKALLVKRVTGKTGLNMLFGNQQLSGHVVFQVNTIDKSTISDILELLADRIAAENDEMN